jgi:hypothetical protein
MSPATACIFQFCRPVAEENAPTRIRPTCVRARPIRRPYRTKRELLFARKIFSCSLCYFLIAPQLGELHSVVRSVRSPAVKKHAALCGVISLVIGCLLSACASSQEQGVVTESTKPETWSPEAHFARPSYAPSGEGGVSSAHSGF